MQTKSKIAATCAKVGLAALLVASSLASGEGPRKIPPPSVPGAAGVEELKISSIKLTFGLDESAPNVKFVPQGSPIPQAVAHIRYSGTGTISGRWEWVPPGVNYVSMARVPDAQSKVDPSVDSARHVLIENFEILLPALGTYRLPGPDAAKIPRDVLGRGQMVLRLESAESFGEPAKQRPIAINALTLHLQGPADGASSAKGK